MDKTKQVDRNALLQDLSGDLLAWKGKASHENEAKTIVFPVLEYSIRMTWLGRRDKLRNEKYAAINAFSEMLLAKELQFSPSLHGDVALRGQDHYALARQLFEDIWSLYVSDTQNILVKPEREPVTEKQALWQWIRTIMSNKGNA
jgi:hypothetical protein